MKKSTFLKVALVAVAMFMFAGANAQVADANYANVAEDIYQTAGKTFRVYVEPDAVYNPAYVAPGWALDAAARWTWTYPAGLTTGAPATGAPANQNWVEFTNPAVGGPFVLTVVESTTVGLGCVDADAETRNIYVVAVPVATITTADPAQACGDQAAAAVAMTFTEAVPAALAGYAFNVEEVIETIDPSDVVIATISTTTDFVEYTTAAKLNTGNDLTGAASPYGFTFNTSALNVDASGNRTRYTYTLRKATDAPGAAADGVISAISQKSDYVGGTVLTHPFGAKTTFVAIVNPTPVTGPIYHIPNNYAY